METNIEIKEAVVTLKFTLSEIVDFCQLLDSVKHFGGEAGSVINHFLDRMKELKVWS